MLQNAPLKDTGIMPPQGLLARAPRRQGMSVAPMSDKALQMQLGGQQPGALALQNAPLMQAQAPLPTQQQAGGQPWDEQIPGEQDPMARQEKRGPGLGNIISEFILNYGAANGNPLATSALQQRAQRDQAVREAQQELAKEQRMRGYSLDDREFEANKPETFMSGRDRVVYNPADGTSRVVYDAPQEYQDYAESLGLVPGSPEYTKAMQDYVLKSSGPTAYGFDVELDNHRTANDIRRRQTPTYIQANPRPPRPRRAASSGRSGNSKRQTATDGKGNRVEWNGQAWVPAR